MCGVQQGNNCVLCGMSSARGQPQGESFLKGKYSKPTAESTISMWAFENNQLGRSLPVESEISPATLS